MATAPTTRTSTPPPTRPPPPPPRAGRAARRGAVDRQPADAAQPGGADLIGARQGHPGTLGRERRGLVPGEGAFGHHQGGEEPPTGMPGPEALADRIDG